MSKEGAEETKNFMMSVGLGDDFIMRLNVPNFEDLRTQIFNVLQACRLPKVSLSIIILKNHHYYIVKILNTKLYDIYSIGCSLMDSDMPSLASQQLIWNQSGATRGQLHACGNQNSREGF